MINLNPLLAFMAPIIALMLIFVGLSQGRNVAIKLFPLLIFGTCLGAGVGQWLIYCVNTFK